MKYFITTILTVAMLFSIVACGCSSTQTPPVEGGNDIVEPGPTEGPEPGIIDPTLDADPISLKVVDQNDITIYFKGQSFDKTHVKFNFGIDNSSDKDIIIHAKNVIVNDIMTEPSCNIVVAAGEVSGDIISWGYNYEISTFHQVMWNFVIIDAETTEILFETDTITIDLN